MRGRRHIASGLMVAAMGIGTVMVWAQGTRIPRPTPGVTPNPSLGKALYEKSCAQCHGTDLRGSEQGPPLVHRIYEPSHHADIAFQLAVRYGTRQHHWSFGDMKPVEGVSPDEVAHIIAYARFKQREAGIQ